jgi:hypothetical protein
MTMLKSAIQGCHTLGGSIGIPQMSTAEISWASIWPSDNLCDRSRNYPQSSKLSPDQEVQGTMSGFCKRMAEDVTKITWAQVGRLTDPGRYMFKFGWLTITSEDLAVWQAYPNAAFTLIRTATLASSETDDLPVGEEFRLGAFELRIDSNYSDSEK